MKQVLAVARPPRWPFRLYNAVARARSGFGWSPAPISAPQLLAAARRRTGFDDLGSGTVEEPIAVLARSFDTEAGLTPFGRRATRQALQGLIEERLKIVATLQRHPEIRQVEVRRPLFVVGLPRTGTTLLYNLLCQDPVARPLLTWESVFPTPPPVEETRNTDRRIRKMSRMLRAIKYAVPEIDQIHELNANAPDEDQRLLRHTFVTWAFSLPGDVPSYLAWLQSAPTTTISEAYRFYRAQLQLLQWRCSAEHWVLKSPFHLPYLTELRQVFPDASIIQTHRDPARVLPSSCSLKVAASRTLVEQVDARRVGQQVLDMALLAVESVTRARQAIPSERIVDVRYTDLVANPIDVVRSIYAHLGYEFSASLERGMHAWLQRHPRNKHGRHRYSLEQFGLDPTVVDDAFASYRDRYAVPREEAVDAGVSSVPPVSVDVAERA